MKKQPNHLLPLFKGKAALSVLETLNHSHIKPYTNEKGKYWIKDKRIINF